MGLLDETYSKAKVLAGLLADSYQTGSSVVAPNQADVEMRPKLAKGLLEFLPGSGDAISGYDAMQSAKQGNYGEAALNGVGLLPFIPAMGGMVKAGKPFTFIRNTEKAQNFGNLYGQNIEPAGRYLLEDTANVASKLPNGWEAGKHTFKNPLFIQWGGEYKDADNWKNVISRAYGGKTGKSLSKAIANDGYDGIVTIKNGETSEIVDLSAFVR